MPNVFRLHTFVGRHTGGHTVTTAGSQGTRERNGSGGNHGGPEFGLYFKFLNKEYIHLDNNFF